MYGNGKRRTTFIACNWCLFVIYLILKGGEDMEQVVSLISSVGFPIAACIYLVFTTNKQLENLTKAVNEMSNAVNILTSKLESEE